MQTTVAETAKPNIPPLFELVSIDEAAYMFYRSRTTIRYHIDRGSLKFRKVGAKFRGVYLIDLVSLIALYKREPYRYPDLEVS